MSSVCMQFVCTCVYVKTTENKYIIFILYYTPRGDIRTTHLLPIESLLHSIHKSHTWFDCCVCCWCWRIVCDCWCCCCCCCWFWCCCCCWLDCRGLKLPLLLLPDGASAMVSIVFYSYDDFIRKTFLLFNCWIPVKLFIFEIYISMYAHLVPRKSKPRKENEKEKIEIN